MYDGERLQACLGSSRGHRVTSLSG